MPLGSFAYPESIKRRLDALRAANSPVNITEVCRRAVEEECDRLETALGAGDPNGIVRRLVDSPYMHGEHLTKERHLGADAGVKWARLQATPLQLAVIECRIAPDLDEGYYDIGLAGVPWLPYAVYYDMNLMSYHMERPELALAFWKSMRGDGPEISSAFVAAFVYEACKEWVRVKPDFYAQTRDLDMGAYGFALQERLPEELQGPEKDGWLTGQKIVTELRRQPPRLTMLGIAEAYEARQEAFIEANGGVEGVSRKLDAAMKRARKK